MGGKRCGDCNNFLPNSANSAGNEGLCKSIIEDDGLGKIVTLFESADKCKKFVEIDRVRTNVSEFMWDPKLRMARGFDEK